MFNSGIKHVRFGRVKLQLHSPKLSTENQDWYVMLNTVIRVFVDEEEGVTVGFILLGFGMAVTVFKEEQK